MPGIEELLEVSKKAPQLPRGAGGEKASTKAGPVGNFLTQERKAICLRSCCLMGEGLFVSFWT